MGILARLFRGVINEVADDAVRTMARDQYIENIFEMVPAAKKVNPIYLAEIMMRAKQGIPVSRPLGSHIRFSAWEKLMFNPVHLFRFPTPENFGINTSVQIGPKARKPLRLTIPIMFAGMSFGGALSKSAKIALARAATLAGTATNTGEAGLLEEEREAAQLLIGQYNRGGWLNTPEKYKRLDAIEIQLGQGAQGSTNQRTAAKNIGEDYREVFELTGGQDAVIHSRLEGVHTKEGFINLVRELKNEAGVPVGLKIAATHYLEKEIEIALEAECDFITVDGAEGGTHGGAPILEDDVGLPTMFAVSRAAQFLTKKGANREVSLIATGGLVTPGYMLKAMALGADAVYIGTAAVMAMLSDQSTKTLPFEPPTDMVVYTGKRTGLLDIDKAVQNVFYFLNACVREMEMVAVTTGKVSLSDIDRNDLVALDPFLSKALNIDLGYVSPENQEMFFNGFERIGIMNKESVPVVTH
ncbi:Glutamate synthase (NADPH) large chain precursor [Pelotomaculum sp. FP]|uniref:FMN-binding glutamate synthase family protein n=1 Tax=Pelotomaculum sp. FP TaxID=261474 RepID=UPI0011043893|nr:FMN-binding glutamate synthase family protein [Pelotomaculum sp. FP]TEB14425.1 Glutamate synthase (NADPH) large chain precursor [Pelotomaculum sp. FP]